MHTEKGENELIQQAFGQLDGTDRHLVLISEGFKKGARMFRLEDATEANEQYFMSLDALQHFLRYIEQIRHTFSLDFNTIVIGEKSIEERLERLSSVIEEMVVTQEAQDWIFLADLIEYELVEQLEKWSDVLVQLKTGIATK